MRKGKREGRHILKRRKSCIDIMKLQRYFLNGCGGMEAARYRLIRVLFMHLFLFENSKTQCTNC